MVYRLILLLLILSVPSISKAESFVDLHLFSYHTNRDNNFNEINQGIIYRDEKENFFYTTGVYYNSENRISVLGGIGKTFGKGFLKASISGGIVSGYKKTSAMALGSIHIGKINLNFIPDPHNRQLVMSVSVNFMNWEG